MADSTAIKSPCCPDGALPSLAFDYEPKGEVFELPGVAAYTSEVKLYVVGASSSEASWRGKGPVLVMMCDAFGPFSGMHRKLADEFAAQTGGIVILPDPFEGTGGLCPDYRDENNKPNQLGFNLFTMKALYAMLWQGKSFLTRFPFDAHGKLLFGHRLIPYFQTKGIDKFGLMGFCLGCWNVIKACNEETIWDHITCAIHFHPAIESCEKNGFGGDDVGLCSTCRKPQMIHATKDESDNWKPNGAAHKVLQENEYVPEVKFTIAPLSQKHGFMTRGDINKSEDKAAIKEGIDKAVDFLKKYNK